MESTKFTPNQIHCEMKSESCGLTHERRCASYKPNIWSYDYVQSLTSQYSETTYKERVVKLKDEFIHTLNRTPELLKPYIVETIMKLGLSNVLHNEIKDALDSINLYLNSHKHVGIEYDLQGTALCFRLLRQHGYNVSQDIFVDFIGEMHSGLKERRSSKFDIKGILELYEASHLTLEGEEIMVKAKTFSRQYYIDSCYFDMDFDLSKQEAYASEMPSHRKVLWFDARQQIQTYQLEDNMNPILLELSKLNFNIVQATHLDDLKEMSRWWKNLGLIEHIGFTRDRLVESFLWTVGVACEPQHTLLRKCLTKVVTFVLVLDDVYDIYGSLEELKCFTRIVERWDNQEIDQLPECMKICFKTLETTTNEIAYDIFKHKGWDDDIDILPYLKTALTDFCKALLQEALWHKKRHMPTLEDYLSWAWITSSGPLLSLIIFLCTIDGKSEELKDKWEDSQDLIYHTSLIIRLLNDHGSSAAELERGEAHSSILCYMAETNVTEKTSRAHMKELIGSAWSKINMELVSGNNEELQIFVNLVINMARVCHFIYQKGDGFSVQEGDTKKKIKRLLFEPLKL